MEVLVVDVTPTVMQVDLDVRSEARIVAKNVEAKPKKIRMESAVLKGIPSIHDLSVQLQSHDAALEYFKFKEVLSDLTGKNCNMHYVSKSGR